MTNLDFMALDGGTLSELLAVPVIVAAWILVVAFLDRWVRKGENRLLRRPRPSGGDVCSAWASEAQRASCSR